MTTQVTALALRRSEISPAAMPPSRSRERRGGGGKKEREREREREGGGGGGGGGASECTSLTSFSIYMIHTYR